MQETWVRNLGRKDSLEKGMATHSSIIWESRGHRNLVAVVHGVTELDTTEQLTHILSH